MIERTENKKSLIENKHQKKEKDSERVKGRGRKNKMLAYMKVYRI